VGVLIYSNDVPVDKWHMPHVKKAQQSQVFLALFSTLANSLLGYAFAEGLAISFWRLANNGTTVPQPPRRSLLLNKQMSVLPDKLILTMLKKLSALHDSYEAFPILSALKLLLRRRFDAVALGRALCPATCSEKTLWLTSNTDHLSRS
jgi:hypothetical protein